MNALKQPWLRAIIALAPFLVVLGLVALSQYLVPKIQSYLALSAQPHINPSGQLITGYNQAKSKAVSRYAEHSWNNSHCAAYSVGHDDEWVYAYLACAQIKGKVESSFAGPGRFAYSGSQVTKAELEGVGGANPSRTEIFPAKIDDIFWTLEQQDLRDNLINKAESKALGK